LVERVNSVVRVAVHNPHKRGTPRIIAREHHIEIHFASFAFDLDFQNALQLEIAAGKAFLILIAAGVLNMMMSTLKKG